MKTCVNCGREEQNDELKFCPDCGTPFSREHQCPSCKYVIPAGSVLKFCPNCGAKIEAKKSDEFVLVEGGNYFNGSENEKVESFYISKIPVTQKLWKSVKGELPRGCSIKGNYKPVVGVSWNEAIEFCNALSKKENLEPVYISTGHLTGGDAKDGYYTLNTYREDKLANGYRLPSKTEWSYACSGGKYGNGYEYPGSDRLTDVAWLSREGLQDVALKKPNELDLYDMLGNCPEWVSDKSLGDIMGSAINEGDSFNPNFQTEKLDSYRDGKNYGLRLARSFIPVDSEEIPEQKFVLIEENGHRFYVSNLMVTQDLWQSVMGSNPSKFKGKYHPVENITLADALTFCNKMSERDGLKPVYKSGKIVFYDKNGSVTDYDNPKLFHAPVSFECVPDESKNFINTECIYIDWNANGYRLPSYGEYKILIDDILESNDSVKPFGWHSDNNFEKIHNVGLKKADRFGLYDIIGNINEVYYRHNPSNVYYKGKKLLDKNNSRLDREQFFSSGGIDYWKQPISCKLASKIWGLRLYRDADFPRTDFTLNIPVVCPVSGVIIKYAVPEGSMVYSNTTVVVIESMKMELEINAGSNGQIHFLCSPGDEIAGGEQLAIIQS